eukprot:gb/GFBE01010820.1/.p1 GENE.gb/GFBE01010820.1/~~gb/GFBE01010820.1/.p1  ORF type:complete len:521 (+),score=77.56 gb/GFBE01010820.1/:1-1563(+)
MAGTALTKEPSAEKCQERCAATHGCHYFSYWHNGSCSLSSIRSYALRVKGEHGTVVAGPRSCSTVVPSIKTNAPELGASLEEAMDIPSWRVHETDDCEGRHKKYSLEWKAQGDTFFDEWQFLTKSYTHGSEWYLNRTEAFRLGLVRPSESGSILRVGDVTHFFKRHSVMLHSAQAWRPDKGFLVVMKYNHVPYGVGIWPSFWTVNSDYTWPMGGEMDILEYANDEAARVSFHTDRNCHLNAKKMDACMNKEGVTPAEATNCNTNYPANLMGCIPRQVKRTGKWYAENPGVIAMAWDASRIAVYHIPEAEIPADLESDEPEPNSWDRWLTAYLPFDAETCFDIAKPQEIVLTVALCGDAAGGPWANVESAKATGWEPDYCWPGHITEPATDCCTKYMTDPDKEQQIKSTSYFDIDYVKVFEPAGEALPKYAAGTFRNGGENMNYPCLPCGSQVFLPSGQSSGGDKCCPGCGSGKMTWDDAGKGGTKICPSKQEYLQMLRNITDAMARGSADDAELVLGSES